MQDVAAECNVSAMPTFIAFLNGERLDAMMGADPKKLKELIEL